MYFRYQDEHVQFLKDNKNLSRQDLAKAFNERFGANQSAVSIKTACLRRNIRTGRTGRFEKGNVPHPDAGAKGPNKTSFKKGQKPNNFKPIGHERVRDGYLERKVTDIHGGKKDYMRVHHIIWVEHNGPVPEGFAVSFRDLDKTNLKIENLMLIERKFLAVLNKSGLMHCPPELKESAIASVKLDYIIKQLEMQRCERNTTSRSE